MLPPWQESRAWLSALACSSLRTLLDNQSFRLSVGLRFGLPICHPHTCHCGQKVDISSRHGLACEKSSGRKARHESINDLIKTALVTCGVPDRREPSDCNRSEGQRPDGITLIPWQRGKPLLWNFTTVDTFSKTYVKLSSRHPKYRSLGYNFVFNPVSIETMGPWGNDEKN